MDVQIVKFNRQDKPEFFRELRSRVNTYFQENNISRHANFNMKVKTVFMIALYATPYFLMVTGTITGLWPVIGLWVVMGLGMSGIGLSVMHDANHGSYSSSPRVNKFVGGVLNFVGGYPLNWRIQHNVLHHSFTNVHGFDEDIEKGVMRFSPKQEHKGYFRFQAFYATFLYGLMTIYWLLVKDFAQLKRYAEKNLLAQQGTSYAKEIGPVIFNKLWYVGLTLMVPMFTVDLAWWQILLGFLLMQYLCGIILAYIFQPAHVVEETNFYIPDDNGSVENNWAIHQMHTTANFANKNRIFSWFVGGLNYQIEHHLFPNICHVHYRQLSKIVKATAEEFNVPYHQYDTFYGALKSHFTLLHRLGTGQYDRDLQKAKAA